VIPWLLAMALASPLGEVEVHARALAPGEPVRVVIRPSSAVDEVTGTFLGRPFPLVRGASGSWTGWALVDLDDPAGPGVLELRAAQASIRHEVTIAARKFPRENLKVAGKYVAPSPEDEARIARERARLQTVYAQVTPPRAEGPFVRPVPGSATGTFGTRRFFNGAPRAPHPGVDLRAAVGTPVSASGPGRVALAGDLHFSGGTVILDHGGGLFTVYAHLSRIDVSEGEEVAQGARIGLSGATGRVTGPHLHWGAKAGDRPFDPAALLDPRLF